MLLKVSGRLAQLVEQWTENPCVPGSNPGATIFSTNYLPNSLTVFIDLTRKI